MSGIRKACVRKEERTAIRSKHISLKRNNSKSFKTEEQKGKLQKANGKIETNWNQSTIWLIRVNEHISGAPGKQCDDTVQTLEFCSVNCGHY